MTNEEAVAVLSVATDLLAGGSSVLGEQYSLAFHHAIKVLRANREPRPEPEGATRGFVIEASVRAQAVSVVSEQDVVVRVFTGDEYRASHPVKPEGTTGD